MSFEEQDFNNDLLDNLFKNQPLTSGANADEIILIVDISGSMFSIREDAQGGINTFIDEQKNIGEANLTIVEFDSSVDVVCERENIKEVAPYTLTPRGSTALYDAVGFTLANAEQLNPSGKVIVAIVTDGGENASREYTQQVVFDRITELKEKEWEFLFLSADQDAFGTSQGLGIDATQTVMFAQSNAGVTAAYDAVGAYTTSLRSGNSSTQAADDLANVVNSNADLDQQ